MSTKSLRFFGSNNIFSDHQEQRNKDLTQIFHVGDENMLTSCVRVKFSDTERQTLPFRPFQDPGDETRLTDDDLKFIDIKLDTITTNELDKLKKICKESLGDPGIVYRICSDNEDKFLVILQKLDTTITNESRRNVVDPLNAKFRGNKLLVKRIINLMTLGDERVIVAWSFFQSPWIKGSKYRVHYEVGQLAFPVLEGDLVDNFSVCLIDYYKTIQGAYFNQHWYQMGYYGEEKGYTGLWYGCDENGRKIWINELEKGFGIRGIKWTYCNFFQRLLLNQDTKHFNKRYSKRVTDSLNETRDAVTVSEFTLGTDNVVKDISQYYYERDGTVKTIPELPNID